jgi:hypothetical protein
VGMVLRPDQTKGFGLYLIAIIIIVLVSALAHFAAVAVLHGKVFRPRDNQASGTTELQSVWTVPQLPVRRVTEPLQCSFQNPV